MKKRQILVYADTSVYGGVFDEEFADASNMFFDQVRAGDFTLYVSEVVHKELEVAPDKVNGLFQEMLPHCQLAEINENALELQQAYI